MLKGVEMDILEQGGLDLADDVLAEADWVVASVHFGQRQSRERITERIIDALENPYVSAIAHPTGRLLTRRKPYEVDLEAVLHAAREHGKCMELNAHPSRLDLDDVACTMARNFGVPVVISTDAHSIDGLEAMRYGVQQARRGGLTAADVANTKAGATQNARKSDSTSRQEHASDGHENPRIPGQADLSARRASPCPAASSPTRPRQPPRPSTSSRARCAS